MRPITRAVLLVCAASLASRAWATCTRDGSIRLMEERDRCLVSAPTDGGADGGLAIGACDEQAWHWSAWEGHLVTERDRCLVVRQPKGRAPRAELAACGDGGVMLQRDGHLASGSLCLAEGAKGALVVERCAKKSSQTWDFGPLCFSP